VQSDQKENYFLDTLLTVFIIHQLVVFLWRGAWEILDLHLFPDDPPLSAITTLVASFVLQMALCLLQPAISALYRGPTNSGGSGPWQRWAVETGTFFFANLVSVSHWRGVWMLLDNFVLPSSLVASAALTHVVGLVVLWLMTCGHSVTMVGCKIDGETNPDDFNIPNKYVRYMVEKPCHSAGGSNVAV
jgi:hypothetical protein